MNHATLKRSRDFSVSGVGAIVCRHGFVRKNGVVDLQKGEKWVQSFDHTPSRLIDPRKVRQHGFRFSVYLERGGYQDPQGFLRRHVPLDRLSASKNAKLF